MLLLLAACSQDIQVEIGQEGCQDYDFSGTQVSTVEFEWTGEDAAKVWRSYDVQPMTSLVFDPVVEGDGDLLHVREAWTGGVDAEDFCYQPFVLVSGISLGVELRWYEDTARETPFGTVEIEPD